MVPVRAFLKSETHWYFKRTADIFVANFFFVFLFTGDLTFSILFS